MKNYKTNVNDYLPEELLGQQKYSIGEEIAYIPFEETEANFCLLQSIKKNEDGFVITLAVENEFNREKYFKEYKVQKGSDLELNTFGIPLMCFLPPEKIPVLVKIIDVDETQIVLETTGILQGYIDNN